MDVRIASCACGQLRVGLRGQALRVSICCCAACRKRTGSAYGAAAFFSKDQIASLEGAAKTFARISDAGRWVRFRFCPECGSTVCWEAEFRPGVVGIALGAFDDSGSLAPERIVWHEHKQPWVALPADIPIHEQQD
jgi:hypothetical protein